MNLQKHIIEEFSSSVTQKGYAALAEKGLWGSEEKIIKEFFNKGNSVLDLGCGTGRTTIPLHKMKYEVVGVDITPAMIKSAKAIAKKKKLKISYELGDATKLKQKKESFDNVLFSNNGWSQIPGEEKRIQATKEIHRVLKPGGVAFFTTHVRTCKGFFWLWTKQWLKQYVLKPVGFPIREKEYGDRFFKRESGGRTFNQEQFIHIPNPSHVRKIWEQAGFTVLLMNRTNELVANDNSSNPMCYVCRKNP